MVARVCCTVGWTALKTGNKNRVVGERRERERERSRRQWSVQLVRDSDAEWGGQGVCCRREEKERGEEDSGTDSVTDRHRHSGTDIGIGNETGNGTDSAHTS